jgi:hypothetical protein
MFSALYQSEQTSPLAALQSIPGGTALAAAATLAALAVALKLWGPAASPAQPTTPPAELALLTARVDSVNLVVSRLRDSLRLAVEQTAAVPARGSRAAVGGRPASGAGAVPAAAPIPAAPRLDSALAPGRP